MKYKMWGQKIRTHFIEHFLSILKFVAA